MQDKQSTRIDAVAEWRSSLTGVTSGLLLYETVTGLAILLLPFSPFNQFNVLLHTILGIAMIIPVLWYCIRHWLVRRKGNLSHYQLLGYISVALLLVCFVSGIVLTWQGIVGPAIGATWDMVHLVSGFAMAVFIIIHLLSIVIRKVNKQDSKQVLASARGQYYKWSVGVTVLFLGTAWIWSVLYTDPPTVSAFADEYNWKYGEDRPFAPSLARTDTTDWQEGVRDEVLALIEPAKHDVFLEAYAEAKKEPVGLFAHVRSAAKAAGASESVNKQIDAIVKDAAYWMQHNGAIDPKLLTGSDRCGTSGCHTQIYEEWLPSAHRYSSLDKMFQDVQTLMVEETSPEHTRYCGGCHDPISLFAGAKNSSNNTVGVEEGIDEGTSCLVCHNIVQTDVQGNADYTLQPQERYVYELDDGGAAKFLSDFLIRTYPKHHVSSYSRPLYKTAEFCAACHKQYLDKEVNTDIGKVQGQNQYDSWKNSRWYHGDENPQTLSCRECHMPLIDSEDPASGDMTDYNRSLDDGKHRGHRTLGANQYIPQLQNLKFADEHTALIEQWMRGEIEIPEIADKWTVGPVVRMEIVAPTSVTAGDQVDLRVLLTNNKTGHDFPTGPLDMIESWVELIVTDSEGTVLYNTGSVDPETDQITDSKVIFKADGFDRKGELIDRHNLWDLVGASYKRSMYPGVTDTFEETLQCPSMARGRIADNARESIPGSRADDFAFETEEEGALTVHAILWYRKANPAFLDRVYGTEMDVRSPVFKVSEATATIRVEAE
ncbi:MAG: cytochrome b/b6 domain-containing protein [Phycisphaerales bacterium]|jgi:hypothetical protein|nr:cytochrome b/b6 domain-containing protein [Phycisphaerales bacterium]